MDEIEYHCQRCSTLLTETEYFGITVYECPICDQLHDEFGNITDKSQLEQLFFEKENNLDELYPHRKQDENEGFIEEVVLEDQKEHFKTLIRLGKVNDVIQSYVLENKNVNNELILETISDWILDLDTDKMYNFINDITNQDLKYSLLDKVVWSFKDIKFEFYERFLYDKNEEICIRVIEILESYYDPTVLEILETTLENGHSYKVELALEDAINSIKDELVDKRWEEIVKTSDESKTDLAIKLLNDEDSHMRKLAANELEYECDPKVLKILESALEKEDNYDVIETLEDIIDLMKKEIEDDLE